MRAFIAVELPEEIKEQLEKFSSSLNIQGLLPVKREAMHITLVFLGEVEEAELGKVNEATDKIKTEKFEIHVKGISYFSPDFVKVIFASISKGSDELAGIYNELHKNLASAGIKLKKEEWQAHITLFRVKSVGHRENLESLLNKYKELEFGRFTVESITVKKSVLTSSGPSYTTLHESKLL